ncbi:MAG: alanine racemase [Candidatus Dadabacteria bacterium]|nr:alanine racemase [Candidatus Dadabacteria bacterium]
MKNIDPAYVDSLVQRYGSPLFLVSAETLENNVRAFKRMFREKYPNTEVAYAYKANYLSGILKIIHQEGAWAEVASGFEYDIARKLGVPGSSIIFNGPGKTKKDLLIAVSQGTLINADNEDEIRLLGEIAGELKRPVDIGIRINADVGINQKIDRFGFNLETGEAFRMAELCEATGALNVICLHLHLTSYIVETGGEGEYTPAQNIRLIWPKNAGMYEIAVKKISRLAKRAEKELGVKIKYIDLGGGFPSIKDLGAYVNKVTEPLIHEFGEDGPVLLLEPGRAIVKDAVFLITTVLASRKLQGGKRAVTTDAGTNSLPTSYWSSQEIRPLRPSGKKLRDTIIYGPLCLQTDIIAKTLVNELEQGDKIVVENVGAYNIPQGSPFIYPRPCVVMLQDATARVIRRAETIDDVLELEEVTDT